MGWQSFATKKTVIGRDALLEIFRKHLEVFIEQKLELQHCCFIPVATLNSKCSSIRIPDSAK